MDKLKRNSDAGFLHRYVAEMLELALAECKRQGLWVYLFEGWRSFERQGELFKQGRNPAYPGEPVTWATPGLSFHQYGLAVDLVFDAEPNKDGPQWTWKGDYTAVAAILKRHGFDWSGDWKGKKELPHFQMTFGLTAEAALDLYKKGGPYGLFYVWEHFNKLVLEYPRRFKDVV